MQPASLVVRVNVAPLTPAFGTSTDDCDKLNLQPLSWVTVKVCPFAVILPVLCGPLFGETVNAMFPEPVPLALLGFITSQEGESLVALHGQPVTVDMATLLLIPSFGMVAVALSRE